VNPETGAVLYDVKFLLRGDKLAYKIEIFSSSTNALGHLAVLTGLYEEFEMKALETVPNPKGGRERVLSSYVRVLRVDERQGKMRLTKLLEELIAVEDSKSEIWDSDILQLTPQRYDRLFFLRILQAEVRERVCDKTINTTLFPIYIAEKRFFLL
jgi:hypothetical protein